MSDRPRILCHMTASIDGGLHPSRYTASPDGAVKDWSGAYEAIHDGIGADGWIVGRVTAAEMAKGEPHAPIDFAPPERPVHVAQGCATPLAVVIDPLAKVHFAASDIGGDHVVVVLGDEVEDSHLAELAGDGISYIVTDRPHGNLAQALSVLRGTFGAETLLLEGGGGINGGFLAEGLVDELSIVLAPALDGAADADRIVATPDGLRGKVELSLLGCDPLANGALHLRYAVRKPG